MTTNRLNQRYTHGKFTDLRTFEVTTNGHEILQARILVTQSHNLDTDERLLHPVVELRHQGVGYTTLNCTIDTNVPTDDKPRFLHSVTHPGTQDSLSREARFDISQHAIEFIDRLRAVDAVHRDATVRVL